jgi:hypothetical protein
MAAALRAGVIWDNTFNRSIRPPASAATRSRASAAKADRPAWPPIWNQRRGGGAMSHLAVAKTYKLFIGGAFPRSESGRTYQARTPKGGFLANAALARGRTSAMPWSPRARASAPGPRPRRTTAAR